MKKQFKLRVVAKEQKVGNTSAKFLAFSSPLKSEEWCTVKFTKDCKEVPTKTCDIILEEGAANMAKKDGRLVLWVNNVVSINYDIVYEHTDLSVYFDEVQK